MVRWLVVAGLMVVSGAAVADEMPAKQLYQQCMFGDPNNDSLCQTPVMDAFNRALDFDEHLTDECLTKLRGIAPSEVTSLFEGLFLARRGHDEFAGISQYAGELIAVTAERRRCHS